MEPGGDPLNIFGTIAHNPKLLKRFLVFAGYFLNKGLLPAREREIVILRVGHRCSAVYEFGQHTVIGARSGLSEAEIRALASDGSDHAWAPGDRDLIAMADELCLHHCVSDDVWARLRERWSDDVLVELVLLAGNYQMVSGFLNTMGVQLEPGTPGWPA